MGQVFKNAASIPLNQVAGTVPNMSGALQGWFQLMTFKVIAKSIEGFLLTETPTTTSFRGVWQPFTAEQLKMVPDGQRSWKYFTVHAETSLKLNTDDVVIYQGTQYRTLQKLDYTEYGYLEYHLVQDYTGSGPNP